MHCRNSPYIIPNTKVPLIILSLPTHHRTLNPQPEKQKTTRVCLHKGLVETPQLSKTTSQLGSALFGFLGETLAALACQYYYIVLTRTEAVDN